MDATDTTGTQWKPPDTDGTAADAGATGVSGEDIAGGPGSAAISFGGKASNKPLSFSEGIAVKEWQSIARDCRGDDEFFLYNTNTGVVLCEKPVLTGTADSGSAGSAMGGPVVVELKVKLEDIPYADRIACDRCQEVYANLDDLWSEKHSTLYNKCNGQVFHNCAACSESVCYKCQDFWANHHCGECNEDYCDYHRLRFCGKCWMHVCQSCIKGGEGKCHHGGEHEWDTKAEAQSGVFRTIGNIFLPRQTKEDTTLAFLMLFHHRLGKSSSIGAAREQWMSIGLQDVLMILVAKFEPNQDHDDQIMDVGQCDRCQKIVTQKKGAKYESYDINGHYHWCAEGLHFCGSCNENVCFECQACWGHRFCWQCMQSFCDKHEKLRYCEECFTDTCESCFEAFQKSQPDRKAALSEASTVAAETEAGAETGHHSEEGRTVAKPKGKRRGKETVTGFENVPPLCPGCYTNRGGDGCQQSGGCCTF
jgi:hypothetical protein